MSDGSHLLPLSGEGTLENHALQKYGFVFKLPLSVLVMNSESLQGRQWLRPRRKKEILHTLALMLIIYRTNILKY